MRGRLSKIWTKPRRRTYGVLSASPKHTMLATFLPPRTLPVEDFLWAELLEAAHEDGNTLSFFVVNEVNGTASKSLYVSPDWPSAEAFAKNCVG
jgi:hypothetical protein